MKLKINLLLIVIEKTTYEQQLRQLCVFLANCGVFSIAIYTLLIIYTITNTCNSATNDFFFKIGGNIPWENITRRFFRKMLNLIFFSILTNLKVHFLKICQI